MIYCLPCQVEKEAKRLEVMKRRQEREMQQMVAYEVMRKELQASQSPLRGLGHVQRLAGRWCLAASHESRCLVTHQSQAALCPSKLHLRVADTVAA